MRGWHAPNIPTQTVRRQAKDDDAYAHGGKDCGNRNSVVLHAETPFSTEELAEYEARGHEEDPHAAYGERRDVEFGALVSNWRATCTLDHGASRWKEPRTFVSRLKKRLVNKRLSRATYAAQVQCRMPTLCMSVLSPRCHTPVIDLKPGRRLKDRHPGVYSLEIDVNRNSNVKGQAASIRLHTHCTRGHLGGFLRPGTTAVDSHFKHVPACSTTMLLRH